MERFAHPAARLATITVLPGPTVTKQPAAGHAPTLDPTGKLPSGAVGIIKGQVDSTGAIIGGDTSLFTVTHVSTGVYAIAFGASAFAATPTIILTVGSLGVAFYSAATAAGFTVNIRTAGGAVTDAAFNFVAYA
jgi:hypothetical protein